MEDALDDTDPNPGDNQLEIMIKCAFVGLIGVFCVSGNILVLRTLIFFKHPKIPIYIIIGGIAVADILRVTLEIPQNVIRWTKEGDRITSEWCQAIFYLVSACNNVAACHLVALSIIRCIMLNDRAHSKSYVKHATVCCVVMWCVTLLANIPNATEIEKDSEGSSGCLSKENISKHDERNYWLRSSFSFIVPLFVIVIVYIVTWYFTQRYFEDSYSHGERRLSRMVTLLIVIFAICKLPAEIATFIVFYKGRQFKESLTGIFDSSYFDEQLPFSQNMTQNFDNLGDNFGGSNRELPVDIEDAINMIRSWMNIRDYCVCLASLDLAIRPIIYAKLSYYFGKSFDEVINCTWCKEDPRKSSKYMKKRKRNGPSQTPLTDEAEESPEPENNPPTIEIK